MTTQSITLQPGDILTVQVPATVIVPPPVLTPPGQVTDLRLVSASESSITLVFTEVSGGNGLPANYDLRYSPTPLVWSQAAVELQVSGTVIGNQRNITIIGLTPALAYQFQIVAYRGTLNVDAVFGSLSNIVSITTLGVVIPPPAPPLTGLHVINDQPWNQLVGNGWQYLRRTSTKDDIIISDSTAPRSPPNALRILFPPTMQPNTEPTVHWMALARPTEIETEWDGKLSPNWTASPAGAGKITFLMVSGGGQVYTNYYHQGGDPTVGWLPGPPFRVGINTEWAPYGQRVWLPNKAITLVGLDSWHNYRVYYKWASTPSASDGIIRWWVDGVLNGDYTNVQYPTTRGFVEFQYAPTRQLVPPTEQWMDIDHTIVRVA